MRTLAIVTAVTILTGACSDVVIKVNKKSKQSELASTAGSEKAGATVDSEDFLKDMDNLRAVAFDMLMKQIKAKDFQSAVRGSIRDFRSYLVKEAQKQRDPSLLNFDQSAIKCNNDRLNLDYDQAHKYLGVILKSAVLAKLSEQSTQALNTKLSSDAAAIAQLLLNEIGLKADGESKITREGEIVTTSGDFKLSLVPFQDESAELQERDAKESIHLKFSRVAGENGDGSFSASISASELDQAKQLKTYEMTVAVSKSKVDGMMIYKSSMVVGLKGADANLKRELAIEQVEAKKYQVMDTLSTAGVNKQNAFIVDIGALSECKIFKDAKKGDKGSQNPSSQPSPSASATPNPGLSPSASPNPSASPSASGSPSPSTSPTPVKGDDDDNVVSNPGQNPGQNPSQK